MAHTTPATPDPTGAWLLQLGAEPALRLESPPSTLVGYCGAHGGTLLRTVASNRGVVHCRNLPPPMVEALGWYCGAGLTEDARLCRVIQTGAPVSKSEAAEGLASWTERLAAQFGPPTEQTDEDAAWTLDRQRVSIFSDHDKTTSEYATSVMVESIEARSALSGQPDFPTGVSGFEFGMARAAAKQTCKRQRGLFIDIKKAEARGFSCMSSKLEAPLASTEIGGLYCDGRLCELSLTLSESSRRALLLMSAKYGDAQTSAAEDPRCDPEAKRYLWQWSRDEQLVGVVRLVDDCSPVAYYDTAEGWKLHTGN